MSTDLHSALRAVIEQRLEAVRSLVESMGSSPWHVEYLGDRGYPQRISNDRAILIADVFEGIRPAPLAEHIARHDPADAIRRYERDLKTLERHRKVSTRHSAPGQAWCCGCYGEAPCPDLSDLLDVYPEVTR